MMLERYPNLKEEVGGSIPGCGISSLLDKILARWSPASRALVLACRPSISKNLKKKEKKKKFLNILCGYLSEAWSFWSLSLQGSVHFQKNSKKSVELDV